MKALVVDDSRAIRVILAKMLRDLGYEVSEARHGREALLHLQSHTDTALALVDWNMPEMNGLELVQAVRAEPALAEVRLMMVTTEIEMSQMVRALEAGAHEYVMKPFTKAVIEDKLRMLGLPTSHGAAA
jgi:two-component system, chemotaxis family, chemotaxis protein CheY